MNDLSKCWRLNEDLSVTDLRTGLTWLAKEPGRYTFDQAKALEDATKRLPTIDEWKEAYKHGIGEVFADNGRWFWSSSEISSVSAWGFSGYSGFVYYDYRDYDDFSVRCVSRKKEHL